MWKITTECGSLTYSDVNLGYNYAMTAAGRGKPILYKDQKTAEGVAKRLVKTVEAFSMLKLKAVKA